MKDKRGIKKDCCSIRFDKDLVDEPESTAGNLSRRKLTKAGMAAPVVMSLISRPAWSFACSPSGLTSGNISGHDHRECNGQGCTPGFWKNNLVAWLGTIYSPGQCLVWQGTKCKEWNTAGATVFQNVFGYPPYIATNNPSPLTLLDVMLEHELAGSDGTFENHLVAALLNAAKAPFIYGATTAEIIAIAQAVHDGVAYQGVIITQDEFFQMLVGMNEAGTCYINAHGVCGAGYVEYEGQCIPSCMSGEKFDVNSGTCILTDQWNPEIHTGLEET